MSTENLSYLPVFFKMADKDNSDTRNAAFDNLNKKYDDLSSTVQGMANTLAGIKDMLSNAQSKAPNNDTKKRGRKPVKQIAEKRTTRSMTREKKLQEEPSTSTKKKEKPKKVVIESTDDESASASSAEGDKITPVKNKKKKTKKRKPPPGRDDDPEEQDFDEQEYPIKKKNKIKHRQQRIYHRSNKKQKMCESEESDISTPRRGSVYKNINRRQVKQRSDYETSETEDSSLIEQYEKADSMVYKKNKGKRNKISNDTETLDKPYMYIKRPGIIPKDMDQKESIRDKMGKWEYMTCFTKMLQNDNAKLGGTVNQYLNHLEQIMEDASKGIQWEAIMGWSQFCLDEIEKGDLSWDDKALVQVYRVQFRNSEGSCSNDIDTKKHKKQSQTRDSRGGPSKVKTEQKEIREVICTDYNRGICPKEAHHMKLNIRWLHLCKICNEPTHPEFECPQSHERVPMNRSFRRNESNDHHEERVSKN